MKLAFHLGNRAFPGSKKGVAQKFLFSIFLKYCIYTKDVLSVLMLRLESLRRISQILILD